MLHEDHGAHRGERQGPTVREGRRHGRGTPRWLSPKARRRTSSGGDRTRAFLGGGVGRNGGRDGALPLPFLPCRPQFSWVPTRGPTPALWGLVSFSLCLRRRPRTAPGGRHTAAQKVRIPPAPHCKLERGPIQNGDFRLYSICGRRRGAARGVEIPSSPPPSTVWRRAVPVSSGPAGFKGASIHPAGWAPHPRLSREGEGGEGGAAWTWGLPGGWNQHFRLPQRPPPWHPHPACGLRNHGENALRQTDGLAVTLGVVLLQLRSSRSGPLRAQCPPHPGVVL